MASREKRQSFPIKKNIKRKSGIRNSEITNSLQFPLPKESQPYTKEDKEDLQVITKILNLVLSLFTDDEQYIEDLLVDMKYKAGFKKWRNFGVSSKLEEVEVLCHNHREMVNHTLSPIVLLQSYIRRWNIEHHLPLILPRPSEHWNSLHASTSTYLQQLSIITKEYQPKMEVQIPPHTTSIYPNQPQNSDVWIQLQLLFHHINLILNETRELMNELSVVKSRDPVIYGLGNIFLRMDFSSYLTYISNIKPITDSLQRFISGFPTLVTFLATVQSASAFPHLSLMDLIRLPSLQISKFESSLAGIALDFFIKIQSMKSPKKRVPTPKKKTMEEKKILMAQNHAFSVSVIPRKESARRKVEGHKATDDSIINGHSKTTIEAKLRATKYANKRSATDHNPTLAILTKTGDNFHRRTTDESKHNTHISPHKEKVTAEKHKSLKSSQEDEQKRIRNLSDSASARQKIDASNLEQETERITKKKKASYEYKKPTSTPKIAKHNSSPASYHALKKNCNELLWKEMKTLWKARTFVWQQDKKFRDILDGMIVINSFIDQFTTEERAILSENPSSPLLHECKLFIRKKEKRSQIHSYLFSEYILLTNDPAKGKTPKLLHLFSRKAVQIESDRKGLKEAKLIIGIPTPREIEITCEEPVFNIISTWILEYSPTTCFGVELSHLSGLSKKQQQKTALRHVPEPVQELTSWLLSNGIVEGIFRKSGSAKEIEHMKMRFNQGFTSIDPKTNPNTVASILKLFFRDLPSPIIPLTQYNELMSLDSSIITVTQVRYIISRLPKTNYKTMKHLCLFLSEMAAQADITKMDASNIGTVFATNILRTKVYSEMEDSMRVTDRVIIMTFLISRATEIFTDDLELRATPGWFKEMTVYVENSTSLSRETLELPRRDAVNLLTETKEKEKESQGPTPDNI